MKYKRKFAVIIVNGQKSMTVMMTEYWKNIVINVFWTNCKMLRNVKFWRYGKEMKSVLKVRISYDSEEELKKVINILSPAIKKLKKHLRKRASKISRRLKKISIEKKMFIWLQKNIIYSMVLK